MPGEEWLEHLSDYYKLELRKRGGPVHQAALAGDTELIGTLVRDEGYDPRERIEVDNLTPLHFAVFGDSVEAIAALMDMGAKMDDGNVEWLEETFNDPLYIALHHGCKNALQYFAENLDKTEFTNGQAEHSYTIHHAMQQGDEDMVRTVLTHAHKTVTGFFGQPDGSRVGKPWRYVDAIGEDGTPLRMAIKYAKDPLSIVRVLIEFGANVSFATPPTLQSPAHCAVIHDEPEVFRELAKAGADLNAIDAKGKTPIQYAEDADRYAKFIAVVVGL